MYCLTGENDTTPVASSQVQVKLMRFHGVPDLKWRAGRKLLLMLQKLHSGRTCESMPGQISMPGQNNYCIIYFWHGCVNRRGKNKWGLLFFTQSEFFELLSKKPIFILFVVLPKKQCKKVGICRNVFVVRRRLKTSINQRAPKKKRFWGHCCLETASEVKSKIRFEVYGPKYTCYHACLFGCFYLFGPNAEKKERKTVWVIVWQNAYIDMIFILSVCCLFTLSGDGIFGMDFLRWMVRPLAITPELLGPLRHFWI